MKIFLSIHRYSSMATVKFVFGLAPVPEGFREFAQVYTNSFGELMVECARINPTPTLRHPSEQYDYLPAQIVCDFLRDNGYEIEPINGAYSQTFCVVAGIVGEPLVS